MPAARRTRTDGVVRTNEPSKGDVTSFGDAFDGLKTVSDVEYYASDQAVAEAKNQFRAENYGNAGALFFKATQLAPNDGVAWLGLAASCDRIHRFDLADRAYGRAFKLIGGTPEYYNNVGYSYLLRGKLQDARTQFPQGLRTGAQRSDRGQQSEAPVVQRAEHRAVERLHVACRVAAAEGARHPSACKDRLGRLHHPEDIQPQRAAAALPRALARCSSVDSVRILVGHGPERACRPVLFVVLFPFWVLRKVGAGDVKLMAVIPFLIGGTGLVVFSLLLLVFAVAMAVVVKNPFLLPAGAFRLYVQHLDRKGVVPFGVPISLAAICTIVFLIYASVMLLTSSGVLQQLS